MSSAAPTRGDSSEDWRPIADRIARHGQDFLDGVTAVASGECEDGTVSLLLLEVAQILLAGAPLRGGKGNILPGKWEPDGGAAPDFGRLPTRPARGPRG